eukprot:3817473-Amphidinium_carterae.1
MHIQPLTPSRYLRPPIITGASSRACSQGTRLAMEPDANGAGSAASTLLQGCWRRNQIAAPTTAPTAAPLARLMLTPSCSTLQC